MITSFEKLTSRAAVAIVAAAGIAMLPGAAAGQSAPAQKEPAATSSSTTTPETFVDALNSAFGKQTTQRATHAKGIVLVGTFTPSAAASSVSRAPHFKQAVPITVRFSDNTGMPTLPDASPSASPHGMAVRSTCRTGPRPIS